MEEAGKKLFGICYIDCRSIVAGKGLRYVLTAAVWACLGCLVAEPSTTGTQRNRRGALIEEAEEPTTSVERARAVQKTELEKHEEKKRHHRLYPGPVYNPDPGLRPPQRGGVKQKESKDNKTTDGLSPGNRTSSALENLTYEAMGVGDAAVRESIGPNIDPKGPGPLDSGQTENTSPSNRVVGAANAVACHPINRQILYAGFTNGGIWKTVNAYDPSPVWIPQTDNMGSLSIGAVEFDLTDPTGSTLIAGVGRFSSLASAGGKRIGILKTVNGGDSWTLLNGGGSLNEKNICGVAMRGPVIMAAVNTATPFTFSSIGILRSENSGQSFVNVAYTDGGLPPGRAFDLQGDPTDLDVFYTAIDDAGTSNGIYKSTNTGATWERVSDGTMNVQLSKSATNNVHIAVGKTGSVFVAIVTNSVLAEVFGSTDGGATWTAMGAPTTTEADGSVIGIHPGGQGQIHLSIAADPINPNVVYVGGDRQPGPGDYTGNWPNSLGAYNYSGRLFRGNASMEPSVRWQHLTHSSSKGVAGGGTASNSAPHADSRDMDFDDGGRLIEGDDGGVYSRTWPHLASGDWFSLQGTLQTTEVHDVAYDSISNKIVAGTQDNGVPVQRPDDSWVVIVQGDGGDVAVDDKSNSSVSRSIRYTSYQNLGALTRRLYNSTGSAVGSTICQLEPLGTDPEIRPQFYTPVELNRVDPTRMLIGAQNGIYESLDQGDTVKLIRSGVSVGDGRSGIGLVYGGRQDGRDYPEVAYAVDGSSVYVRGADGMLSPTVSLSTGGHILLDVTMDTENYANAYCIDKNQVFKTADGGRGWVDTTGDLIYKEKAGDFRCVEFLSNSTGGAVCVGTQTGVYIAETENSLTWRRFGVNLPASAYVYDIEYDATDDVLVVGTLGRGIWMMKDAAAASTGSAVGEWLSY